MVSAAFLLISVVAGQAASLPRPGSAGKMSALPPKADMCSAQAYVRFVPQAAYSITSLAHARSSDGGIAVFPALASARYWINFVHTAKYKTKLHAVAINTIQIAIFPKFGTGL